MYKFNHLPEVWAIKDYAPVPRKEKGPLNPHAWGVRRAQRLLFAAYTIAFLCLLRFDEVLKIQLHDIEFVEENCFELTLPFRKTDQFGSDSFPVVCEMLSHEILLCA